MPCLMPRLFPALKTRHFTSYKFTTDHPLQTGGAETALFRGHPFRCPFKAGTCDGSFPESRAWLDPMAVRDRLRQGCFMATKQAARFVTIVGTTVAMAAVVAGFSAGAA